MMRTTLAVVRCRRREAMVMVVSFFALSALVRCPLPRVCRDSASLLFLLILRFSGLVSLLLTSSLSFWCLPRLFAHADVLLFLQTLRSGDLNGSLILAGKTCRTSTSRGGTLSPSSPRDAGAWSGEEAMAARACWARASCRRRAAASTIGRGFSIRTSSTETVSRLIPLPCTAILLQSLAPSS